jgi:hypothetical protein
MTVISFKRFLGVLLLGLTLSASTAGAASITNTYHFSRITSNGPQDPASQFSVDVVGASASANTVSFYFHNSGPIASAISEIYFDDGTLLGLSSVINSVVGSTSFGNDGSANPSDLPAGNSIAPPFQATAGFSTDAQGNPNLGLNPGETMAMVFSLQTGKSYTDTIAFLDKGVNAPTGVDDLRIGLHVRAIGTEGNSESFVTWAGTPVPEPAEYAMAALGVIGLGVGCRRFRRSSRSGA